MRCAAEPSFHTALLASALSAVGSATVCVAELDDERRPSAARIASTHAKKEEKWASSSSSRHGLLAGVSQLRTY